MLHNCSIRYNQNVALSPKMMKMAKNEQKRSEIIDRLADHVLAHGLVAASLRPLAKAAGTSDRMLLYYFADKAEIIGAALARIAERMTLALASHTAPKPLPLDMLITHLSAIVLRAEFWPYMCVWLELASRAGRGDPNYAPVAAQIGEGFLAWGAMQLDAADEEARARDAARLLVVIEGMVLVKAIGLNDVVKRGMG
jgi:AcrR family transcriptional regulator